MLPSLRTTLVAAVVFLVLAPTAQAWTWPASGPVLQEFRLGGDPYAAGQHRGIDIGGTAGAPVAAPRTGVVSFAGSLPTNGLTLTVETADGYSVTLVRLGSIAVARGAYVLEGAAVGTIGSTGSAEQPVPYVHLGVRTTADPNGYLDPLSFLPGRAGQPAGGGSPTVASTGAVAPKPTKVAPPSPSSTAHRRSASRRRCRVHSARGRSGSG